MTRTLRPQPGAGVAGFAEADDAALASFRDNGFLLLRGFVCGAELEALRQATERMTEAAIAHGRSLDARGPAQLRDDHGFYDWVVDDPESFLYARDAEGRRVWRRAENLWARDVAYRAATVNPRLLDALERAGGAGVLPNQDAMVVKLPGSPGAIPWHRDPGSEDEIRRSGNPGRDFVCAIYVDASTLDNGCVWAIPGSHHNLDQVADPMDPAQPGAVAIVTEPGDVTFHSVGLMHCSPAGAGGPTRRTFYLHCGTDESLRQGIFQRSPEWLAEQRERIAAMQRERRALGWD